MANSRPDTAAGTLYVQQEAQAPAPRPERADGELLAAYLDGNERAFELLFERWGGKLFNYICRFTGSSTRAEDVYQEVCIKVATNAAKFDGQGSVAAWIFRIARNAAIDVVRAEARKGAVSLDREGGVAEPVSGEADPAAEAARRELRGRIRRAVESLPDEQREAFLLKEEGGLTFEEIGRVMNCGRETAKSRLRYALDRLRNCLGKEARTYGLQ